MADRFWPYVYPFIITHVYDADTYRGIMNKGHGDYKGQICEDDYVNIRAYGLNMMEIRKSRSKKIFTKQVNLGYDQRDAFLSKFGIDGSEIPRKAVYQEIPHTRVYVQSMAGKKDKNGRILGITYTTDFENLNEYLRDISGGVEFYDRKEYPQDYPIRAPNDPIYDRYMEEKGKVFLKPEFSNEQEPA